MIKKCVYTILIFVVFGAGHVFAQDKDISPLLKTGDEHNKVESVKVAAVQLLTSWDIEDNERKITEAIIEAAEQGVEIILFQEGALTNYPVEDDIEKIDFEKVRAAEKRILSLSKKHNIAILLSSSSEENGKYYNHVVIANENGKILGRYAKTWRAGDKPYEPGTGPVIFTVAGVEATVIICHDIRYPELPRLAVAAGAQIIFIANNESGLYYEDKLLGYRSIQIARAAENIVYSVMANSAADPKDAARYNASHGNSKIVEPLGDIIDEAGYYEERLVIGTLDLKKASRSTASRTIGKNEHFKEFYCVEFENQAYQEWMQAGLKLVKRLDGTDVPEYLKEK
ncbi:MAG: carbon-nitrogen hydrolase family protein [Bacteroidota bacterium]